MVGEGLCERCPLEKRYLCTDQGWIEVSGADNEDGEVLIMVKDTGRGIRPDDLPFVFDAFFQAEESKSAKGTGIGLAVAKTWIEAHGGEIHAESEGIGKGSLFWFTLPK